MSDAPLLVDAGRLVLAVIAGGTALQLAIVAWQDRRRPRDRERVPAQVALLLTLGLIVVDDAVRVGEAFVPYLLVWRAAIVAGATWYVLERQGHLARWRDRRRRRRL